MTIVGRTGHMDENGEYLEDTVTVHIEESGGWAVDANDVSEQAAEDRGHEAISAAKRELRQQVHNRVQAGFMREDEAARVLEEADA